MKLKYYLRGLGIGIIITTIILSVAFKAQTPQMSDKEIIAKAKQLGMVMKEDDTTIGNTQNNQENEETPQAALATEEKDENAASGNNTSNTESTEAEDAGQAETENTQPTDVQSGDGNEQSSETEGEQTDDNSQNEDGQQIADASQEQEPHVLVVKTGDVCRVICETLQENGVIDDAEAFRNFLGQKGLANSITTGTYTIPYGLSYEEIYQIMRRGGRE